MYSSEIDQSMTPTARSQSIHETSAQHSMLCCLTFLAAGAPSSLPSSCARLVPTGGPVLPLLTDGAVRRLLLRVLLPPAPPTPPLLTSAPPLLWPAAAAAAAQCGVTSASGASPAAAAAAAACACWFMCWLAAAEKRSRTQGQGQHSAGETRRNRARTAQC
jgi:hypothetical protein